MPLLKVGKPYNPKVKSWPEGIEYNWRGGAHELRVMFRNWSRKELTAWRRKELELALYVKQPMILLLTRPQGGAWSDSPYFYHRVPADQRGLPPRVEELSEDQTAPIQLILIEATNGLILGLRRVHPPREFMTTLHDAIREQAEHHPSLMAFDGLLLHLFQRYDSAALAERAVARCKVGRGRR